MQKWSIPNANENTAGLLKSAFTESKIKKKKSNTGNSFAHSKAKQDISRKCSKVVKTLPRNGVTFVILPNPMHFRHRQPCLSILSADP